MAITNNIICRSTSLALDLERIERKHGNTTSMNHDDRVAVGRKVM